MNNSIIDKLVAGICYYRFGGAKRKLSYFELEAARFLLIVPLLFILLPIFYSAFSFKNSFSIPLIATQMSYLLAKYFTSPNFEIINILGKSPESDLNRWFKNYLLILLVAGLIFMILLLL